MSAITTVLVSGYSGLVSTWNDFWIMPLLGIAFYWVWFVLFVIFAFFVTLPIDTKKPVKKPSKFYTWLFNFVNGWLIVTALIKVQITGLDKLDPNTGYLLVSNHRSKFDPQITGRVFKKFKFLAIINVPIAIILREPVESRILPSIGDATAFAPETERGSLDEEESF